MDAWYVTNEHGDVIDGPYEDREEAAEHMGPSDLLEFEEK